MKLEALEKTVVTARGQARVLETKVRQLTQAVRIAKDAAKRAKSKLKLAKQEAKRSRRAAKEAKRTLGEMLTASEAAASELARLERKIKKARKKAQESRPGNTPPKRVVKAKAAASTPPRRPTKPVAGKPRARPLNRAKPLPAPVLKQTQPVAQKREGGIQVPRDFEPKPSVTPSAVVPKTEPPTAPESGANN